MALEGVYKVRIRRFFGLFWLIFDSNLGGNTASGWKLSGFTRRRPEFESA